MILLNPAYCWLILEDINMNNFSENNFSMTHAESIAVFTGAWEGECTEAFDRAIEQCSETTQVSEDCVGRHTFYDGSVIIRTATGYCFEHEYLECLNAEQLEEYRATFCAS